MPDKTGSARAAGTTLPVLNAALAKHPPGEPLPITERVHKGERARNTLRITGPVSPRAYNGTLFCEPIRQARISHIGVQSSREKNAADILEGHDDVAVGPRATPRAFEVLYLWGASKRKPAKSWQAALCHRRHSSAKLERLLTVFACHAMPQAKPLSAAAAPGPTPPRTSPPVPIIGSNSPAQRRPARRQR